MLDNIHPAPYLKICHSFHVLIGSSQSLHATIYVKMSRASIFSRSVSPSDKVIKNHHELMHQILKTYESFEISCLETGLQ